METGVSNMARPYFSLSCYSVVEYLSKYPNFRGGLLTPWPHVAILALLLSSWTVEIKPIYSAYAKDFANAVSGKFLS